MEISKQTLEVLKNFSQINNNLLFKVGNEISTESTSRDLIAEVTLPETFPQEAGIYNLNEFLGVVSLFTTPKFDFEKAHMTISEGNNKIKYAYADASLLSVPKRKITMPQSDIDFTITQEHLSKLHKAATILGLKDMAIIGENGNITVQVYDSTNATTNKFAINVESPVDIDFTVVIKVEKLKFYSGDYDVSLSKRRISRFAHREMALTYYVAIDPISTFD